MPAKKSKGIKPKGSLLDRQREKLKVQRGVKAASQANAAKSAKQLPPKGGTSANSVKAGYQRLRRKGKLAEQQVKATAEAWRKTVKHRVKSDQLEKAAKGTSGTKTTYKPPAGTKAQKALPSAPARKALPPSRSAIVKSPGGQIVKHTKGALPPAKGAKAALPPAKGPKAALPPAKGKALPQGKAGGALGKIKASGALKTVGRGLGAIQLGVMAAEAATEAGYAPGGKNYKEFVRAQDRLPAPKAKPNVKKVKYPTAAETQAKAPKRKKYPTAAQTQAAAKAKTPKVAPPKKTQAQVPARTPASGGGARPAPSKSARHTYDAHGSKLHIGRYKTLAEHRAAVARTKKKAKPDSSHANDRFRH